MYLTLSSIILSILSSCYACCLVFAAAIIGQYSSGKSFCLLIFSIIRSFRHIVFSSLVFSFFHFWQWYVVTIQSVVWYLYALTTVETIHTLIYFFGLCRRSALKTRIELFQFIFFFSLIIYVEIGGWISVICEVNNKVHGFIQWEVDRRLTNNPFKHSVYQIAVQYRRTEVKRVKKRKIEWTQKVRRRRRKFYIFWLLSEEKSASVLAN